MCHRATLTRSISLTTPRGDQIRTPVDEKQNALIVTSTEMPGNYQLRAGGGEQGVRLGFSANLPAEVSQLEPASADDLKAVFGDMPFRLAHNRDEIDRSVSAGRVGQELFPFLMVMLVLALALEQVLANRFYQDYDTAGPPTRAAQFAARAEPRQTSENSRRALMTEWYFNPVGGYALTSAVALLLVLLLTFWGCRGIGLRPRRRRTLLALRLAVIFLAMFAMLRPRWFRPRPSARAATLVVLADRSRSMVIADAVGGKTRWDVLTAMLAESLPTLRKIGERLRSQAVYVRRRFAPARFFGRRAGPGHAARRHANRHRRGARRRAAA